MTRKDPARNYGFSSSKGRVRFPLNQSPAFDPPLHHCDSPKLVQPLDPSA
jgi:hypothetical protein